MERGLRDLIGRNPTEEFRGVYVESGLNPTRKNVLAPGAIGVYSGGSNYNPAQIMRDETVKTSTEKIDKKLAGIANKNYAEMTIEDIQAIIRLTMPDQTQSERIWNPVAVAESLAEFAKLQGHVTGYVYVDRDRDLEESRRETAGWLSGEEFRNTPLDKIVLYIARTKPKGRNHAAWWPQIRFPDGRYAFAFAI